MPHPFAARDQVFGDEPAELVAIEDAKGHMVAVQKRASGAKGSCAGVKQVFRGAGTLEDVIGLDSESLDGERLLLPVESMDLSLAAARQRLARDLAVAPEDLRSIEPRRDGERFSVTESAALAALQARVDNDGRFVGLVTYDAIGALLATKLGESVS